jgi:hypothetical protein
MGGCTCWYSVSASWPDRAVPSDEGISPPDAPTGSSAELASASMLVVPTPIGTFTAWALADTGMRNSSTPLSKLALTLWPSSVSDKVT